MKKILLALASATIVVPTCSTIIACDRLKNDQDSENSDTTILGLIRDFEAEISSVTYRHLESKRENLIRLIDKNSEYNDFFTIENIKKYGKTNIAGAPKPVPLEKAQKQEIVDAFNNLLDIKQLTSNIERIGTSSDKYQIIINNYRVLRDITLDVDNIKLNYTESGEGENSIFLSSAEIRLEINYVYLDYNKTQVNRSIQDDIYLTVTDSGTLQQGIRNMEDNLSWDLLNANSDLIWLSAQQAGYEANEGYKIFELYGDKKRINKLREMLPNQKLSEGLNEMIVKQKYFEIDNVPFKNPNLDFTKMYIKDDEIIDKIQPLNFLSNANKYDITYRTQIFEKLQENSSAKFVSGEKAINKEVFDIMNSQFSYSYTNFQEKLWKNFEGSISTNISKDNMLYGKINLTGLSLQFKELSFTLPINGLSLNYFFRVSEKNWDSSDQINDSALGEAAYFNTISGIKSFQKNFGLEDVELYNVDPYGKFKVPLKFSGTNSDAPLTVNIWDRLPKKLDVGDDFKRLNTVLSLEDDNLSSVRFNLMTTGYQGSFGLKYFVVNAQTGAVNNQLNITDKYKTVVRWNIEDGRVYCMTGDITLDENNYSRVGFKLELNLMSLAISFDEINNIGIDHSWKFSLMTQLER